MKELHRFYAGSFITIAVAVAIGAGMMPTHVLPWLKTAIGEGHWLYSIASNIVTRIVLLGLLTGTGWFLQERAWQWLHPKSNLNGLWEGTTEYAEAFCGNPPPLPISAHHQLKIDQNSFSIRVVPAESKDYVNWHSLTAELEAADRLVYAYRVNYKGKPGFPANAIGYEELNVVERDDRGRPSVLTGQFAHTIIGTGPFFRGTVRFERRTPVPKRIKRLTSPTTSNGEGEQAVIHSAVPPAPTNPGEIGTQP